MRTYSSYAQQDAEWQTLCALLSHVRDGVTAHDVTETQRAMMALWGFRPMTMEEILASEEASNATGKKS